MWGSYVTGEEINPPWSQRAESESSTDKSEDRKT